MTVRHGKGPLLMRMTGVALARTVAALSEVAVVCTPLGACGLSLSGSNAYVTFGPGIPVFTIETWFKRLGPSTTTSTGGMAARRVAPHTAEGGCP